MLYSSPFDFSTPHFFPAAFARIQERAVLPSGTPFFPSHVYDEQGYLNLLQYILSNGVARPDRTGTGTIAIFGPQLRFNLRDGRFPLLTTKQVMRFQMNLF